MLFIWSDILLIQIRPHGVNGSGPVVVYVNLHVRSIENIDDIKMEYTAQITFRQSWIDTRVKFFHLEKNAEYLQLVVSSRIWMPDIFVANEKKGILHQLITPNLFTRIYANGTILQSYRITLLLSCPMMLQAYPMDIQSCPIRMASYGWSTKDLILKWRQYDSIQMNHLDFNMPQFKFISYQTENCASLTISGNFSCINLQMLFKRSFGFYLIQIYVPCSMLVIVSWVSFWLEPTAVEARVSLGVTTILTVVTQTYGINQTVPPASYVKAIDIFTAVSQIFVFGGLLQFALVNYITRVRLVSPSKYVSLRESKEDEEKRLKAESKMFEKCLHKAKRIDRLSRIGFPAVFCLFNVTYWSSYFPFLEAFLSRYSS